MNLERAASSSLARQLGNLAPWLLSVLFPLGVLSLSYVYIIDDAYITFRYAYNLAHGGGLTFNTGEYVEGFTNLSWTLLSAMALALDLHIETFAVTVGASLAALALLDAWQLLRTRVAIPFAVVACLHVSLFPAYWLASTNGLEAGLYTFLLVRSACVYTKHGCGWRSSLAGALVFATRPEGLVVVPCFIVHALATKRPRLADIVSKRSLTMLLPWLGVLLAISTWRWSYYGALWPNSLSAKSMIGWDIEQLRDNVAEGVRYYASFLAATPMLTLGALSALFLAPREPIVWLIALLTAAPIPAVLINGGDWMPEHRLLIVYCPLLALNFGIALQALGDRLRVHVVALVIALIGVPLGLRNNAWRDAPTLSIELDTCWGSLTEKLRPVLRPHDVIAPEKLGYISYLLPQTYMHDPFGLTDAHIAKHGTTYVPQYGKIDPVYTTETVRPNLFVSHSAMDVLDQIDGITQGSFARSYVSFRLDDVPGCEEVEMSFAARRDDVARLLPAFGEYKITRAESAASSSR